MLGILLWDSSLSQKMVWCPYLVEEQGYRLLGFWVQTLGRAR